MRHAQAHLFVAREADANRAVADLRALHQPRGRLHHDGHARLVVGAQQGRPVAGDERLADQGLQLRVLCHADHLAGVARQRDVASSIVLHHLRSDASAGRLGRRVQVAHSAITGTGASTVAGIVAKTIPCASCCASLRPSSCNSRTSMRPNRSWPFELGYAGASARAVVSTFTYRRNRRNSLCRSTFDPGVLTSPSPYGNSE